VIEMDRYELAELVLAEQNKLIDIQEQLILGYRIVGDYDRVRSTIDSMNAEINKTIEFVTELCELSQDKMDSDHYPR